MAAEWREGAAPFFFLPFGQPRASVTMVLHVIEAGIQYVKERKN